MYSNNRNKLIQGRAMVAVKSGFSKCATWTGKDSTGLGRWKYVDVFNEEQVYELSLHVIVSYRNKHLAHIVNYECYF